MTNHGTIPGSQINFRKEKGAEMKDHPFKMPFAPVTNYLTIAFLD
jgi:AAT family amino acid transporter